MKYFSKVSALAILASFVGTGFAFAMEEQEKAGAGHTARQQVPSQDDYAKRVVDFANRHNLDSLFPTASGQPRSERKKLRNVKRWEGLLKLVGFEPPPAPVSTSTPSPTVNLATLLNSTSISPQPQVRNDQPRLPQQEELD